VRSKSYGWKNLKFSLFVHSTQKKLHNELGLNGNVYSTQLQAALPAVIDVIKESVSFIIIICFFTVGSVIFLQLSFL